MIRFKDAEMYQELQFYKNEVWIKISPEIILRKHLFNKGYDEPWVSAPFVSSFYMFFDGELCGPNDEKLKRDRCKRAFEKKQLQGEVSFLLSKEQAEQLNVSVRLAKDTDNSDYWVWWTSTPYHIKGHAYVVDGNGLIGAGDVRLRKGIRPALKVENENMMVNPVPGDIA